MKPSSTTNDNLIDRTIELWQPRLRRELNREDARQIVENVAGFFNVLSEWTKTEAFAAASNSGDHVDVIRYGKVRHQR